MRRTLAVVSIAVALLVGLTVVYLTRGGASELPNRDPTGELFPNVVGQSLEQVETPLPEALAGAPAVVLVGYLQQTQFDIDRWLMGLIQAETSARIVEVPTIPGLAASFASGWIDDGMRSGIPREDWGAVVTVYGSAAEPIARLTGTEAGRRTRVLVLDAEGRIVWFDDEGYSARKALEVAALVQDLAGEGADTETESLDGPA